MKNILLAFIVILFSFFVRAQERVTLSQTDEAQIWSIVELALQERGIEPAAFNASSGTLKSVLFEYTTMMIKNHARYQISLNGSSLSIDLIDREYATSNGWSSAITKLSKSSTEKYLTTIAERITEIAKDQTLVDKLRTNSRLFPVFKDMITANGLTMNIESTRMIGDKLMISGKYFSNKPMTLKGMTELTIITPNGSEYKTGQGVWAGERTNYLPQVKQNMQIDIPVSFDIIFDTKGESFNEINLFSVKMYEPKNTNFTFHKIKVPMQVDANINASCIEIYKNVYLTFRKQESTSDLLKIYFSIENKSGKEQEIKLHEAAIIDSSGNSFNDCTIYIAGERHSFSNQKILPDIPISGYFEFNNNIPFSSVKLLQFATQSYAKFALKQIIFEP